MFRIWDKLHTTAIFTYIYKHKSQTNLGTKISVSHGYYGPRAGDPEFFTLLAEIIRGMLHV